MGLFTRYDKVLLSKILCYQTNTTPKKIMYLQLTKQIQIKIRLINYLPVYSYTVPFVISASQQFDVVL